MATKTYRYLSLGAVEAWLLTVALPGRSQLIAYPVWARRSRRLTHFLLAPVAFCARNNLSLALPRQARDLLCCLQEAEHDRVGRGDA